MARAAAQGAAGDGRYSDPTALSLLTESERQRVEHFRSGESPWRMAGLEQSVVFEVDLPASTLAGTKIIWEGRPALSVSVPAGGAVLLPDLPPRTRIVTDI